MKGDTVSDAHEKKETSTSYSAARKAQIMAHLHDERKRTQKNVEAIKQYFADKKIFVYKGKEYYKVKDYKNSFYIKTSFIENLNSTVQEIELERSGYTTNRTQKGFIKWDPNRKCVLISLSKVRVYYKPFQVESA
jgi:hypothetical protein